MNRATVYLLLLTFGGGVFFTSCNTKNAEVLSTELRINIEQSIGGDSIVKEGVVVELYRNQADMQMRRLPVTTGKTNSKGQVVFKNLRAVEYYIYAYIDEGSYRYDNSLGEIRLLDDLVQGSISVAKVYIGEARPIEPSSMTLNYIEILKFDTVIVYKNLGSHCSDSLRFFLKLFDSSGGAIAGFKDSSLTYNSSNGSGPFKYCNFCYESGNAPYLPVYQNIFLNNNTFKLSDYSAFTVSIKIKKASYPFNIYPFEGNGSSINTINFSEYNNSGINPAYPTRFRLLEYPSSSAIINDRYIDAVVTWN